MIQSILRQTVHKNLSTVLSAKCSTTGNNPFKKEINRVTLVGTVFGEQFKNDFGQKVIRVKTKDEGSDKYRIHTLYTSVPQDYEAGQRIFVGGSLNSKELITSENKRRNQPIIKAFQIYALNSVAEDEMKLKDLNSVELLAFVSSNVLNKDDHSIFQVVTNFQTRTQDIRTNFHAVFVFDYDLCGFVRNNLEQGDRIYLRGSLNNRSETDADGKKKQSGYITADSIDKVTIFNRRQSSQQETSFAE